MGDFFGKKWKKLLAAALFAAGLLAAFRYALPLAAPFLLAFAVVHASTPLLERVHRRLHIRREILLAGLFVSGTGLLIVGLCACLSWGTLHAARLGEGAEVVRKQADGALKGCCDFLEERLGIPAKELEQEFSETWDALAGQLKKEALPKAVDRSVEGCRLLISAAGFIGIWMIASVLLCRDYEEIAEKIQKTELGKTVWQYAERTLFLIGGYFKAQAAILTAISLIAAAGLFAAGDQKRDLDRDRSGGFGRAALYRDRAGAFSDGGVAADPGKHGKGADDRGSVCGLRDREGISGTEASGQAGGDVSGCDAVFRVCRGEAVRAFGHFFRTAVRSPFKRGDYGDQWGDGPMSMSS